MFIKPNQLPKNNTYNITIVEDTTERDFIINDPITFPPEIVTPIVELDASKKIITCHHYDNTSNSWIPHTDEKFTQGFFVLSKISKKLYTVGGNNILWGIKTLSSDPTY